MSRPSRFITVISFVTLSTAQAFQTSHQNSNTNNFESWRESAQGTSSANNCAPQSSILKLTSENSAGSGTLVRVPEGFSIPSGLYVLTAEHVIKQADPASKPVADIRKANEQSPYLSSMTVANTSSGKNFQLKINKIYRSANKGEAVLVPVQEAGGIPPVELKNKLGPVSGQLDSYGHAGGSDTVSHASLKKKTTDSLMNIFSLGGFKSTTQESGTFQSGSSGGPVFNQQCEIVGVNSAIAQFGNKAVISSLRDLLTNPEIRNTREQAQPSSDQNLAHLQRMELYSSFLKST